MTAEGLNVLVVDDDPDTRDLVNYVLERNGFLVSSAAGALDALEAMRRQPPDAVITDLSMPGMDGREMAHAMRSEPQLADIPILILSGVVDAGDLATNLGACEVLAKPVLPAKLIGALRRCLGR
jgi:CheY-like chemotaxis protein